MSARVSIVILGYNAGPHFEACLGSIYEQTLKDFEVIWVDSASADDSVRNIKERFPQTRVLSLNYDAGYRRGGNLGAAAAQGEFLLLCNQDTRMDTDCLARLVACMEGDPTIAVVAPKILLFDNPRMINEVGNALHYTGLCGSRGLGASSSDYNGSGPIVAVSGCCFLIRRSVWVALNGFSEDFDQLDTGWHASLEDTDLAWRAQLAGHQVVLCSQALMYHKYEQKGMTPSRFCTYEWGRHLTIWRNYSATALFLLAPLLLVLDGGVWLYALSRGGPWLMAKAKVTRWLFANVRQLRRMRQCVQAVRRVHDAEIVRRMDSTIRVSHVLSPTRLTGLLQRSFDVISGAYYRFLLLALRLQERHGQGVLSPR